MCQLKKETRLDKVHEILKDPECSGNIRCFTWAFVVLMMHLSFLVYGLTFFSFNINISRVARLINKGISEKWIEDKKRNLDVDESISRCFANNRTIEKMLNSHKNKIHYGRTKDVLIK